MSQQEKIKFVVKNGRYAGSVIELDQEQEYSLGRSFHCDIAIDDPRFAERQMLLKVGTEGVQIKLLAEGKLAVDGVAKDTNAQSEWRSMDPQSVFVMNDLEFSFEAPASVFAGMQQQAAAQPEMATATASVTGEATRTQPRSSGTPDSSASASPASQTFDELETQVPGDDISAEEPDVQIQVVPNLADELDFDTGSEIRYRKSSNIRPPKDEDNSKQRYIIGGAIFAGLVVILGAYYYIGLEPTVGTLDNGMSQSLDQQSDPAKTENGPEAGQSNIGDSGEEENGFTPFVMQDGASDPGFEQPSFTDPQSDDPFVAYDRLQQGDASENGSEKANTKADLSTALVQEDMSGLEKSLDDLKAKNAQDKAVDVDGGQDIIEDEVASKSVEVIKPGAKDKTGTSDKPGTLKFDKALPQDPAFGQLSDNQAAQLSEGVQQKTQDADTAPADTDTSGKVTKGYLAVLRGDASPSTIVVPATRDLLDGLGFGYLSVVAREPRQGEVPPVIAVSGYVDNRQAWIRAKEILRQDVQELGTLVDNVSSPEVRKTQLDRWIAQSDIKDKVQTYLSERGLIAKVNLNPSQVATWQAISKQYVKKFENNPELFVMRDPGDWLQIQSISFGDRPYLVTQGGAVLLPGAKLENGYSIVAIRRSGIELKDQFGSYTYVF